VCLLNKKLLDKFQPSMRFYLTLMVIFAVFTFFFGHERQLLAIIEVIVIILLAVYTRISANKRSRELLKYIESVTNNMESATKDTLVNFPLPVAIFSTNRNDIIWSNSRFLSITGEKERFFEVRISDVVKGFDGKWLLEGKNECPELITVGGRKYKVYGSLVHQEREPGLHDALATTYWLDVTDYAKKYNEYLSSRPVTAIIMLDNYDELFKNMSEKEKSATLSAIDDKISAWTAGCGGFLVKYDRDRYIFLFEERYLKKFVDDKFSLLDSVRDEIKSGGINATISIGLGKDGKSLDENFRFATLGIEMALSRGGDQAVIRNRYNFEFYGGHSAEVEKRTKVKSRVMANAFGELVNDASTIFIMGHKYADLDTVGAAAGICCIARARGKRAQLVIDMDTSVATSLITRLCQFPEYKDAFITVQDAILEADSKSLLVIVDTNRPEQVESEALLLSCNHVAVIDHHRRAATYIENVTLNFHEPYASSASELVAEMLQYLVDQSDILRVEAEALLTGIVLDTKSFAIRTGSRTFDAAAFLRRAGADTTDVKKLMQSDFETAMARFALIRGARIYRDGIAIASSDQPENRIIVAQAADELLNIAGVQASFVVSVDGDAVFISARSIGNINVQVIIERLGGGGNQSTAGVKITGMSKNAVMDNLKASIDKYLEDNG
jgi:c-di-AMP phosphodiesterase-like protein